MILFIIAVMCLTGLLAMPTLHHLLQYQFDRQIDNLTEKINGLQELQERLQEARRGIKEIHELERRARVLGYAFVECALRECSQLRERSQPQLHPLRVQYVGLAESSDPELRVQSNVTGLQ